MSDQEYMDGLKIDEDGVSWISNYVQKARIQMNYKIKEILHFEKSPFQEISIVDSKGYGRMLVLDGIPQVSMKEGFIYNEMISHIPIVTHAHAKKVAMIGGGDCGHVRETMKYREIELIDVVEIDERVTEVCRKWLTPAAYYENDKRVQMNHVDGLNWIQEKKNWYDVLMIDRSDPVGPSVKLFKPDFYQYVFDALTDDGVVVFQSGSPFYNLSTIKNTSKNLKNIFPIVRTYLVTIPLFPCGIWSFTLASKKWDPLQADLSKLQDVETQYINSEVFRAAFALPNYVKKLLEE